MDKLACRCRPNSPAMIDAVGVQRFSFVDAKLGWAVDQKGRLMTTTDGGKTWAAITPSITTAS
ncbi:MAG: hypothetical protein U0703_02080 [Anaerolineae bacterium]